MLCGRIMLPDRWRNLWTMVLTVVVLASIALSAKIALSYPENIRLGYNGCASCHVSPTGGGVLTNYGRTLSQELASAVPWDDTHLLPDWVAVGGDVRSVRVQAPTATKLFLMQAEYEAAVHSGTVWLDGSVGLYGPDRKLEMRRNYVLWQPEEHLGLRAGRFFPAYGVMTPDHTTATRGKLGFVEGGETYNLELSAHSSVGDLTVTDTFGGDELVTMSAAKGYRVRGDQPGCAVRVTAYPLPRLDIGASYWFHTSQDEDTLVAGPFATWGITRDLYLLTEAGRRQVTGWDRTTAPVDVTWTLLGYELWPGVHLRVSHEYDLGQRYGVAVQLLPMPHVEVLGQAKWQDGLWTTLVMTHWNW